jgi:ABC-type Na+ efflux pump permease subunit
MRKFLVILQREYAQLVHKKSFLFTTLLTPFLMAAMMFLPAFLMQKGSNKIEAYAVIDRDGHGLGRELATGMAGYRLSDTTRPAFELDTLLDMPVSDSASYRVAYDTLVQDIRDGSLTFLLIIRPEPHLADSNLLLVTNSDNIRSIGRFEYQLCPDGGSMSARSTSR